VDGDEQGVRIVPVDILGAVAVMAIGVHDGHPVDAVGPAQVFDHDGFDVDIAEAAAAVHHPVGMMPRGGRTRAKPRSTLPSMTAMPTVLAPPALMKWDSVITAHGSGTQK
jgi:hypothetical protein